MSITSLPLMGGATASGAGGAAFADGAAFAGGAFGAGEVCVVGRAAAAGSERQVPQTNIPSTAQANSFEQGLGMRESYRKSLLRPLGSARGRESLAISRHACGFAAASRGNGHRDQLFFGDRT
jgi:hypothetical protein